MKNNVTGNPFNLLLFLFIYFYLLSFITGARNKSKINNKKTRVRPQSDSKTPQKLFQNQDPQGHAEC